MMDSCLLYRDSSAEGRKSYYAQYDIIKDINLDILFRTMGGQMRLSQKNVVK